MAAKSASASLSTPTCHSLDGKKGKLKRAREKDRVRERERARVGEKERARAAQREWRVQPKGCNAARQLHSRTLTHTLTHTNASASS